MIADDATLAQILRAARGTDSQERLALRLGVKKQTISALEMGRRVPKLALLLRLHEESSRRSDESGPLSRWLLAWLEAEARSEPCTPALLDELTKVTGELRRGLHPGHRGIPHRTRLLHNFPDAFDPLTIIAGDRRELTPKSVADTFIYSGAITDLTSLPELCGRNVSIRSDKLAVVLDDQALKNQLGRSNLLVLGSPAVNWVARMVNHQAIFRFNISAERQAWTLKLVKKLRRADMVRLRIFWQVVEILGRERPEPNLEKLRRKLPIDQASFVDWAKSTAEELLGDDTPKQVMNEFRGNGIVDPVDRTKHGVLTGADNDFALVSLAPNPYAGDEDFVAILVAGIHGPGTSQALRALTTEPSFFADHPLGGVMEISLNRFVDWSTRFQNAYYDWQTEPYNVDDLQQRLVEADPVEVPEALNLVALISRATSGSRA